MDDNGAQGTQHISVGEAADLLGVHRNTIRNRIKSGQIKAIETFDEQGVKRFRVDVASLDVSPKEVDELHAPQLPSKRTQGALPAQLMDKLDDILNDSSERLAQAREELGYERARREMAEAELHALQAELAKQSWFKKFFGF